MDGIVTKSTGSWYDVRTPDGKIFSCRIKGKMKLDDVVSTNPVAVGDRVKLNSEENGDVMIESIYPRANYFVRESPRKKNDIHILAANLDQVLVVLTISLPRTSLGFVDRLLTITELQNIPTCIVFNKTDIQSDKNLLKQKDAVTLYKQLGYRCFEISAIQGLGIKKLMNGLSNKTTLITGHSGSGKTTLINQLVPGLDLTTKEISRKFEKGQHTTTYTTMYDLPESGYIIDSPGIKEVGMLNIDANDVGFGFKEIRTLEDSCKFSNCLHINEPQCAVKEQLTKGAIVQSRYYSYLSIVQELQGKRQY